MSLRGLHPGLAAVAALVVACSQSPAARQRPEPTGPDEADPLVYRGQLIDVLPRDGIPSLDDPRFVAPGQAARWLAGREPIIAVELSGDARAYPLGIISKHEIVNDVVGGEPVSVTYCPLCNSAVVFERQVDDRILEFGVSGKLYRSALVMYDRQTESLWTHFDGLAVQGPLTGTRLGVVPSQLLSFGEWRRLNPGGRVLSRDTGFPVDYSTNQYEFYDQLDGPYQQFFPQAVNHRLPAMARVVGVSLGGTDVAFAYRDVTDRAVGAAVVHHEVGKTSVVILWTAGTASALDAPVIAEARDVGATGVFVPRVAGEPLRLAVDRGRIVDRGTGSTWSVAGRAISGPMEGTALEPVSHLDSFWFAWQAYRPDTLVYGVDG